MTPQDIETLFNATPPTAGGDNVLPIIYATQMGAGEEVAVETADVLTQLGVATQLVEFYDFQLSQLAHRSQALFIISTYVCGTPPDMAQDFTDQVMMQPAALTHLRYGLLALGDRIYDDDYCRFGYAFNDWLKASGARAWFDVLDVDDEDPDALDRWNAMLEKLVATHRLDATHKMSR